MHINTWHFSEIKFHDASDIYALSMNTRVRKIWSLDEFIEFGQFTGTLSKRTLYRIEN